MTFVSMCDKSGNGKTVHSSVELCFADDAPFSDKPWIVKSGVNYATLFEAGYPTLAIAKTMAAAAHRRYLASNS